MFPLGDQKKLPGRAVVTYIFILINAYVFYLELTVADINDFVARFGLIPAQLSLAEPVSFLTLITSQFLHAGWFHILTNMWFLLIFGPNIEKAWGSAKYALYYLFAGVGAAATQLTFTVDPTIPILGASGAIAGVLGAYFVYFPHHRITTLVLLGFIPIFIGIPAGLILIYWFGLQLAGGLAGISVLGGVAFFAHVGGFLAGLILAVVTRPKDNINKHSLFV